MNKKLSYPKEKINVLLLENVDEIAKKTFIEEGYKVEVNSSSLNEKELIEKIKNVSIIGIRSKTILNKKILSSAKRLLAIGAFCIGTNQIDLEFTKKKGIIVFNAPYSNTRSVVEIVIGQIILLIRNIVDKNNQMQKGIWKKNSNNSFEIRNKVLGIVGYGNIGSQLSTIAESIGMKVIYYDKKEKLSLGNAKKYNSLNQLIKASNIISIHVDGKKENTDLIDKNEFEIMKKGTILINYSRGNVVNINELKKNILLGKIHGAAIDVFPKEPKNNNQKFSSVLIGLPNTILTPHIGGSTKEAQKNIGAFVPNKVIDFINTGATSNSVNFPSLVLPELKNVHRFIHIHKNIPNVMLKINKILSEFEVNILGQYLKTNDKIGYVITDINKKYNKKVIKKLKDINGTIKLRVLY